MEPVQEDAPASSWSDLPVDLAGVVLRRLPRHADRVRFAAVCRQWRSSARHSPLPPYYPWFALPDRSFYSLPGSAFQPLPLHLDRHRQIPHAQSSCGEWLMFERQDGAYTLVSPFSMATTILLPGLCDNYARKEPFRVVHDEPVPSFLKLVVCFGGCLVAAIIDDNNRGKLALCRPGASSWSVRRNYRHLGDLHDMVLYQDKLYVLDLRNGLFSLSIGNDEHTNEPTVSGFDRLIEIPEVLISLSPHYLVESNGALLMVDRDYSSMAHDDDDDEVQIEIERAAKFKVFEADFARLRWTEVGSIGDNRVLFVGPWCSRVVDISAECNKGCICAGDRIFFFQDDGTRAEGYLNGGYRKKKHFYCSIYDMRTRRSELFLEASVRPLKGFSMTWLFPLLVSHTLREEEEEVTARRITA